MTSGPWVLWVHGEDIYVAPRDLGGVIKASLHEKKWQVAYTKEHMRHPHPLAPEGLPQGRIVHEFEPQAFRGTSQWIFAIGVLPSALVLRALDPRVIHALASDRPNRATVLKLYVTDPGLPLEVPRIIPPSPLKLRSGRGIWLAATEEEVSEPGISQWGPPISSMVGFVDAKSGLPPGFVQVGVNVGH